MMKRIVLFLALALSVIQVQDTFADLVMDFQDLESSGSGFSFHGYTYTVGDWVISHPTTEPAQFATAQTGNAAFYQGSTMLFNNTLKGVTTFERIDGGLFDMQSIDIAGLFVDHPARVAFTSNRGDVEIFTTPNSTGAYAFSFSDDFNSVTSVSWPEESPSGFGDFGPNQFDNIHASISVIPEPSSCCMLALIGMAIANRRRRKFVPA